MKHALCLLKLLLFLTPLCDGFLNGGTSCLPSTALHARAKELREAAKSRVKSDTPRKLTKAQKRARKAYFRDRYASSGLRLPGLQADRAFYIGVVGKSGANTGAAAEAIQEALRRKCSLKVGEPHETSVRADVRVVDCGEKEGKPGLADMPLMNPTRFAQLRRCNMLVHVVRCFHTDEAEPDGPVHLDDLEYLPEAAPPEASQASGTGATELVQVPEATPEADIKHIRAEMAYADLEVR
ncbi:unnamed protein product [Chrysoparadoxa australica]